MNTTSKIVFGILVVVGCGWLFTTRWSEEDRNADTGQPSEVQGKRRDRDEPEPGAKDAKGHRANGEMGGAHLGTPEEVVLKIRSGSKRENFLTASEIAVTFQRGIIESAKNYDYVLSCLLQMNEEERRFFLRKILRTPSPEGVEVDFKEKSKMLETLGLASQMRNDLLEGSGEEDIVPLLRDAAGLGLSPDDLVVLFRATISERGVGSGGEALLSVVDAKSRNQLVPQIFPKMLAIDSFGTSKFVSGLPAGELKDLSIHAMLKWLKSKGDLESAAVWEQQLSDRKR